MIIFETLQTNGSFYNLQKSVLVGREDVPKGVADPSVGMHFLNDWSSGICIIDFNWILS